MRIYTTAKLSDHIDVTPEGYLVCHEAALGRTGVMRYRAEEVADEVMEGSDAEFALVYRDEDAVFSPETLASFEGKPLTIDHPEEDVDPDSWRDLAVGVVMDVRRGHGRGL